MGSLFFLQIKKKRKVFCAGVRFEFSNRIFQRCVGGATGFHMFHITVHIGMNICRRVTICRLSGMKYIHTNVGSDFRKEIPFLSDFFSFSLHPSMKEKLILF